jgi:hypothetical protein
VQAGQTGFARLSGLCGLLYQLPDAGRIGDAMAIADEALTAARSFGWPSWTAWSLYAYGRVLTPTDPAGALQAMRQGLAVARDHRMPVWTVQIGKDAALLEALNGDVGEAVNMFDELLNSCLRSGDMVNLTGALAAAAIFFDRAGKSEVAATVYGGSTRAGREAFVLGLSSVLEHLGSVLGSARFEECVAAGAGMELPDVVRYAREQLRAVESARPPS